MRTNKLNSDTDEHLLLTNTITEGKNKKQNYNWHIATAFNEINWNKTAEDDKQLHKQHYQLHLLLTSLTCLTVWQFNRCLYFISNVLFDLTILVISVCFSYALDPWLFIVSFSLVLVIVFVTHICYDKKRQEKL